MLTIDKDGATMASAPTGRRLRPVGAAAALTLLVSASMALPGCGSSSGDGADCQSEQVCVYPSSGFGGQATEVQDEACHNVTVGSVVNNDPDKLQELRVFAQPGCTGTQSVVAHSAKDDNVSGKSYQNSHQPGG